jgi:nucleotide-binding universal stress UspA family protein
MRLERIVIGVDFGAASAAAARWTARCLAPDAELTLVHCIATTGRPLPWVSPVGDHAAARLAALRLELAPSQTRVEVRIGDPADCIAAVADELDADLIVVGPHNRRSLHDDHIGSTAERLVARSSRPVLLATGEMSGPPRRLLVPILGRADASMRVVAWARAFAAQNEFRLAVVLVGSAAQRPIGVQSGAPPSPAIERWRGLAGDCPAGGFFVDAVRGDPAAVILAQVERFATDLVLLDASATAAMGEARTAAAVGRVLRGTGCPVLVTTEPVERRWMAPSARTRSEHVAAYATP